MSRLESSLGKNVHRPLQASAKVMPREMLPARHTDRQGITRDKSFGVRGTWAPVPVSRLIRCDLSYSKTSTLQFCHLRSGENSTNPIGLVRL